MALINQPPHLANGTFSYEKLVAAIEKLETENIISFEEFKKMPYHEIKRQYFSMPNPTMMERAIILIEDKRKGKEGPSEHTTVTKTFKDGTLFKTVTKTKYF